MTRQSITAGLLAVMIGACLGCEQHGHPHGDHAEPGAHGDHAKPGAHGDHADHGAHGHGDGIAIGITRWTDKLELFAEHPPAVVGQKVPFLAHLTILDGFAALEDAKVTLELTGPADVFAHVDKMLRSGIFQPTFVAKAAGTYAGRLVVSGPEVQDTLDGFEIVVHADEAAARAAHAEDEDGGGTITFLKEQQWKVPFATAFAERRMLVPTVEVTGEVDTPPGGSAEIGAPIAGRIVAPRAGLPSPGQTVTKGQLLATIAPAPASPEGRARASLAVVEAQARVAAAEAASSRATRLIGAQAISQREVEDAKREARVSKEALSSARRAASLFSGAASGRGAGTYRLTSPIDGVLLEVNAKPGSTVAGGDVLFRVVNSSVLWIRARVPEQDAPRLNPKYRASYRIAGLDAWLPIDITGEQPNASLVMVGKAVDRRSRTVDVIYALHDPDPRLLVGGLVHVNLPVGEPSEGVALPREAILRVAGASVVYVQVEGEAFAERSVRTGSADGGFMAITAGVEARTPRKWYPASPMAFMSGSIRFWGLTQSRLMQSLKAQPSV